MKSKTATDRRIINKLLRKKKSQEKREEKEKICEEKRVIVILDEENCSNERISDTIDFFREKSEEIFDSIRLIKQLADATRMNVKLHDDTWKMTGIKEILAHCPEELGAAINFILITEINVCVIRVDRSDITLGAQVFREVIHKIVLEDYEKILPHLNDDYKSLMEVDLGLQMQMLHVDDLISRPLNLLMGSYLSDKRGIESDNIKRKILETQQQMKQFSEFIKAADVNEARYNEMKDQLHKFNLEINFNDNIALIGPKGTGKTSFLWINRFRDEPPNRTSNDSTLQMEIHGKFIDMIGCNYEVSRILKCIALLQTIGIPEHCIFFVDNDRSDWMREILGHLFILKYNVTSINHSALYDAGILEYHRLISDKVKDEFRMSKDIRIYNKEQPLVVGVFRTLLRKIFPTDLIELPSWNTYLDERRSNESLMALKIELIKSMISLRTRFYNPRTKEYNQQEFMNQHI